MKQALVQSAMPASATTQDFTDAGVSSDLKLALFFNTNAVANDTTTAEARIAIGATDGTNQAAYGTAANDNIATSNTRSTGSASWSAIVPTHSSGTDPAAEAALGSVLSNGVRLSWSDIDNQQLINALLLSGSDVQAAVNTATFSGTGPPQTVTVTPGFTPDVVILLTHCGASATNGAGNFSIGFYDRVANAYAGQAGFYVSSLSAAGSAQLLSTAWAVAQVDGSAAVVWSATVGNFTATQFDITTATAATSDIITAISLKITNGVYKVGFADTPTSTGNSALVTGMSAAPSCVLWLLSRMTAVGTGSQLDPAGVLGLGVSVNNNGSTQQMYAVAQEDDASDPTVDKCQTGNAESIRILDAAGVADVQATVQSWDSGGVTLNFSNINASAFKIGYLAIGAAAAAGTAGPLVNGGRLKSLVGGALAH